MKKYRCGDCGDMLPRGDVIPPVGCIKPRGMPWRCRKCHGLNLRGQLAEVVKNLRNS